MMTTRPALTGKTDLKFYVFVTLGSLFQDTHHQLNLDMSIAFLFLDFDGWLAS